jgi:hypothetical protein
VAPLEHRSFRGNVSENFADFGRMAGARKTPIYFDDPFLSATCTDRKWSSVCGYNFDNYMESWTDHAKAGSPEHDRLPVFATLDGNVNVTTAWLDVRNITLDSEKFQRIDQSEDRIPLSCILETHDISEQCHHRNTAQRGFLQRLGILIMD